MHKAFDVNAYHYIIKTNREKSGEMPIKLYREIEARQSRNNVFVLKTKSDIFYITHDSISHIVRQGNKSIIYSSETCMKFMTARIRSLQSLMRINSSNAAGPRSSTGIISGR